MMDPSWREIKCKDMLVTVFINYFVKIKVITGVNCECEKCAERIGLYHLLECKTKSLTLSQAAKLKLL